MADWRSEISLLVINSISHLFARPCVIFCVCISDLCTLAPVPICERSENALTEYN